MYRLSCDQRSCVRVKYPTQVRMLGSLHALSVDLQQIAGVMHYMYSAVIYV